MLSGGSVSPWRSGVEEGRSPLGRFRKPEPCFPRTYATWDAKKDENRFESMKFRLDRSADFSRLWVTRDPGAKPVARSSIIRLKSTLRVYSQDAPAQVAVRRFLLTAGNPRNM